MVASSVLNTTFDDLTSAVSDTLKCGGFLAQLGTRMRNRVLMTMGNSLAVLPCTSLAAECRQRLRVT